MKRLLVGLGAILAITAGFWSLPAGALNVPPAPSLNRPVVDTSNTLSEQDITSLSDQINTSRKTKDYQIGILMIPTLGNGEYLEGYSLKVARQWGIGDKTKDNGVLILVVKNDRKMRIEVGRGFEGNLTDAQTGRIIRDVVAPEFRSNNYAGGLSKAIASIQAVADGRADPNRDSGSSDNFSWWHLAGLAAFGLVWLGSVLGRSKSWWAGGVLGGIVGGIIALIANFMFLALLAWGGLILFGLLFDFLVSRTYRSRAADHSAFPWWIGGNWGGGGGGFGGGGGGGSFGGGGFGGGGSSGSW